MTTLTLAIPLVERELTPDERKKVIDSIFWDAIDRIEGIHDPTRIGMFGPSLRMHIRPGVATSRNVFGDRWILWDGDANIHRRVSPMARGWLFGKAPTCTDLQQVRPSLMGQWLDNLSDTNCRRIEAQARRRRFAPFYIAVGKAALSLPLFASPYPGNRLSAPDMRREQEDRIRLLRESQQWRRPQLAN